MLDVRRRELIALVGGAAVWPFAARAQQPAMPVLGILHPICRGPESGHRISLCRGTQRSSSGAGSRSRPAPCERDCAPRQSRCTGGKGRDDDHPNRLSSRNRPVKVGLVTSLNRPGGNITGVSNVSTALAAKRLELLHKFAPDAATIGVLVDPTNSAATDIQTADLQEAASGLGLRLILLNASNENEIDAAFARLMQQRVGALLLTDHPLFNSRREQLVTLARFIAIPTMYTFREFAVSGGLISYASSITDATRRAGVYVARVLKGEKPADLPIQLPTKFELVINLKTAKALGINAPPSLLALADEVIE
jgi:putative tryptophan/tyrosine transport system substrate-binding protein